MKSKIITLLLSTVLAVSVVTGCGKNNTETVADTSADNNQASEAEAPAESADSSATESEQPQNSEPAKETSAANFEELIASLHAGQSYAYAPICEGDNALLVTNYTYDDSEGHRATYEATIYRENGDSVERVTSLQSGGTAYPLAVAEDNTIILCMRSSLVSGYISKETGKFVVKEQAIVDYSVSDDCYHTYKDGVTETTTDPSIHDELSDKYHAAQILNFEKAGILSDGTPNISGAVYTAHSEDGQNTFSGYYIFENETSGHTETFDGLSAIPFTYEISGEDITFHFGSADDTSEGKFNLENPSFPKITFTGDNETISLTCLGNEDPETFDAAKRYNNDDNLFMVVRSFDETTLTGDTYREERIKAEYVDSAEAGDVIYSVNGTPFTTVSFEDANKEVGYGTDEDFVKDVVGMSRFDRFLVKDNDDDTYYALEKSQYEQEYRVVYMLNEGNIRKLIEENVTFKIKEYCEIYLEKFVSDGEFSNLEEEFFVGVEFKGDNYPGWSADAQEYYMTDDMLVRIGVLDGELFSVDQIYVP